MEDLDKDIQALKEYIKSESIEDWQREKAAELLEILEKQRKQDAI